MQFECRFYVCLYGFCCRCCSLFCCVFARVFVCSHQHSKQFPSHSIRLNIFSFRILKYCIELQALVSGKKKDEQRIVLFMHSDFKCHTNENENERKKHENGSKMQIDMHCNVARTYIERYANSKRMPTQHQQSSAQQMQWHIIWQTNRECMNERTNEYKKK